MSQYNLDEYCPKCRCYMDKKPGGWRQCGTRGCSGNPDTRRVPLTVADAMTVPGVRELVEYLHAELTRCGWFVSAAFKQTTLDKIAPLLAALKGSPEDRHPYRAHCDCVRCDHVRGDVEPEHEPEDDGEE